MTSSQAGLREPWLLSTSGTESSFNVWKDNMIANLKLQWSFKYLFRESSISWEKLTPTNPTRGFTGNAATIQAFLGILSKMLCYISSYVPYVLVKSIEEDTTCLEDVWTIIKAYYRIEQASEVRFIDFVSITRAPGEIPQHLYQRILSHLQVNLLEKNSNLKHNGETLGKSEEMSPTVERLAVLRWMELIHPRIPSLVQRTFARELHRATLKDLQPQICVSLDSFLEEIRNDEARVDTVEHAPQVPKINQVPCCPLVNQVTQSPQAPQVPLETQVPQAAAYDDDNWEDDDFTEDNDIAAVRACFPPESQAMLSITAVSEAAQIDNGLHRQISDFHNYSVCQKTVKQTQALQDHLQMQTDKKSYKCQVCDQSFCNQLQLGVHIRMHSGEKLYKCYACDEGFWDKETLVSHMRTHTGGRIFLSRDRGENPRSLTFLTYG